MFQPNEVILLLLGLITLAFAIASRRNILAEPRAHLLVAAFSMQLLAWVLTNLEGLFLPDALNTAEHLCTAVSVGLLFAWLLPRRPSRAERS